MSRDATIPLILWISTAVLLHAAGGGGAVELSQSMADKADIRGFMRAVQHQLRPSEQVFEVTFLNEPGPEATPTGLDATPTEEAAPDEAPDPEAIPLERLPDAKLAPEKKKPTDPERLDPKLAPIPPEKKPEEKKPEEPKPQEKKPDEKKPDEKKPDEKKPDEIPLPPPVVVPPPPPMPPPDERIAVRQHAEKDQPDNPTATRIADDANHTEQETVARIRSHDQDDPNPTPGTHVGGPKGEIGNADRDDIAHSEQRAGDPSRAPGEGAEKATSAEHAHRDASREQRTVGGADQKGNTLSPTPGAAVARSGARQPEALPSPGGAGPASPEVVSAEGGAYSLDPANPGGDGRTKRAGKKAAARPPSPLDVRAGAPGVARLSQRDIEATVGADQLQKERLADGASRRSKHRGSWEGNKFERWRAAIENYEPSVKVGNQTSLNAARVPFATYINTIHNRLHPIFAEEFLAFLDELPDQHALSDKELVTHLEIVLNKDEGRIVRLGITQASGVTAFDVAALNSVSRASPYGRAPEAVVSPDGNVYLHWEFHRDPQDACTTRHARPYLLRAEPPPPPSPTAPRRPSAPASDDSAQAPLLPLRNP
jgi:hypothetical protein